MCSAFGLITTKDVFINHSKAMKKECIFCAETVKICAAASEYIFVFSANVWLLLAVFQCFLMNVQLLLKDISERLLLKEKNVLT